MLFNEDYLDQEWVVRNLLGGMSAGFGLRGKSSEPLRLTGSLYTKNKKPKIYMNSGSGYAPNLYYHYYRSGMGVKDAGCKFIIFVGERE